MRSCFMIHSRAILASESDALAHSSEINGLLSVLYTYKYSSMTPGKTNLENVSVQLLGSLALKR